MSNTYDERLAAVRAAAEIIPSARTKRAIDRLSLGIKEQPKGGAAADTLAWHAEAIRALGKRVIGDAIEMGRHLTAAKELCGHGHWLPWLKREFGWSDKTAEQFMNVYRLRGKFEKFSNLDLPISGLYLLARPSTPEAVRQEVIERVERGEKLSVAEVKDSIAKAGPNLPPTSTAKPPTLLPDKPEAEPPTQNEIFNQIVDLAAQLNRDNQLRIARRIQNMAHGRA